MLFAPVTPVFPTSYLPFILPKTTKMQIKILLVPQLLVHLIHARHIRASEKLELYSGRTSHGRTHCETLTSNYITALVFCPEHSIPSFHRLFKLVQQRMIWSGTVVTMHSKVDRARHDTCRHVTILLGIETTTLRVRGLAMVKVHDRESPRS